MLSEAFKHNPGFDLVWAKGNNLDLGSSSSNYNPKYRNENIGQSLRRENTSLPLKPEPCETASPTKCEAKPLASLLSKLASHYQEAIYWILLSLEGRVEVVLHTLYALGPAQA